MTQFVKILPLKNRAILDSQGHSGEGRCIIVKVRVHERCLHECIYRGFTTRGKSLVIFKNRKAIRLFLNNKKNTSQILKSDSSDRRKPR